MTRRRRPGPPQTRRPTRPSGQPPRSAPPADPVEIDPSQLDLMAAVREAVDDSNPLNLLQLVSSLASIDYASPDPLGAPEEGVTFRELLDTFMEVVIPETSAILAVAAATTTDELFRARLRRELVERRHRLPGWLRQLDLSVTRVERVTDPFGDSENIAVGVRIGTSHEFTMIVLVDHHNGTAVKDSFVIDVGLADAISSMRAHEEATTFSFTPIERADARAQIEEALEAGDRIWPPFEAETWPGVRPLLEWVLATMPAGGRGWERPEWSRQQREALADAFLASKDGQHLTDPVDPDVVDTLVTYSADYDLGDPLLWSPTSIELLLLDWAPRKLIAPRSYLERIPVVLRPFVEYAHGRSGLGRGEHQESLEALDRYVPEYLRSIADAPEDVDFDPFEDPGEDFDVDTYMLSTIGQEVGGAGAMWALNTTPLPDEPMELDDIPADIRTRVVEVNALVDGVCDDEFDPQFRTACRRLLHDISVGDPDIFRRRSSAARTAATIAWIAAKTNHLVGYGGVMAAKDLLALFGVSGSVSQRAEPMQRAIGVDPYRQYGVMNLGTSRYLTSHRREALIGVRDLYEARRLAAESD